MIRRHFVFAAAAAALLVRGLPGDAQTAGLGIQPGRLEIELQPGSQKTVSFEIESPPSGNPVRGRLLLSLTDWDLRGDGSLAFFDPGTHTGSAAPWIAFSPAAMTITSGEKHMVRVTVTLPPDAKAGEYRAGMLIQERPPATPPRAGEQVVVFRFRHFVSLYVMVPPVAPRPSLTDVRLEPRGDRLQLLCRLKNEGSLHVRPYVTWSVRDASGGEVAATRRYEATVLLPFATLDEAFPLQPLPPGRYEVSLSVDFQDKGPVQSMTRTVSMAPAPAAGRE